MRAVLIVAAAMAVTACVSAPSGPGSQQLADLSKTCADRGGALVPVMEGHQAFGGYVCTSNATAERGAPSRLREAR